MKSFPRLAVVPMFALAALTAWSAQTSAPQTGDQAKPTFKQRAAAAKKLYKGGDAAGALAEFQKLATEDPTSSDAQAWLGFLLLQAKRPEDAVGPLEKAAKARPNDLEVLSNLGSAYSETGRKDEALAEYLAVQKLDPKFPEAAYNIGTIFLGRKDFSNAQIQFKNATSLAPSDPYAWNDLGVAEEGLRHDPAAAAAYARAAALKPDATIFQTNAGMVYFRMRNYDQAARYLGVSHAQNPTDADACLALAESDVRLNRPAAAAALYDQLKDAEKDKPAYWFNVGYLKERAGDSAAAEDAYRRCLDLDGDDLDALNNLGMLLFGEGKYPESEVLFDKLSGLSPNNQEAKHNLAVAASKAGDATKATDAWRSIVRSDPAAVGARVELANALWSAGKYDEAYYHFHQALLLNPKNPSALNGVGLYELRNTKLQAAAASFRAAMAASPKFIPAYNNLALALEKLNKKAEAIKILAKGHAIAPDDPDINRNLLRLKGGS